MRSAYGLAGLAGGVLLCEHVGRVYNIRYLRASWYITKVYDALVPWFSKAGRLYADIAAFLSLIDLWELWKTGRDILVPTMRIITLPLVTGMAIVDRAHELSMATPIVLGSVWLGALSYWHVQAYLGVMPNTYLWLADTVTAVSCIASIMKIRISPRPVAPHQDQTRS